MVFAISRHVLPYTYRLSLSQQNLYTGSTLQIPIRIHIKMIPSDGQVPHF